MLGQFCIRWGHRGILRTFEHAVYCTSAKSSKTGQYDLTTYRLPFTQDEQNRILTRVNQISSDELSSLKVTKRVIQQVVKHKAKVGSYGELPELLTINGLGVHDVESLCSTLLCDQHVPDSAVPTEVLKGLIHKKRLFKPRPSSQTLDKVQTVVSLHVTAGFLAWAKVDRFGRLEDLNSTALLKSGSRYDTPRIYDTVVEVARTIPEGDLYVWEEGSGTSHMLKAPIGTLIIALQLAQIRGMLTALLETKWGKEKKKGNLIFMKDILVPRLFKLQRGEERQSPLSLVDKLMEGQSAVEWLPILDMAEKTRNKYLDTKMYSRRYAASAVLVGLAFQQVILAENTQAFRTLL